jgi:transposase InsO family protein
MDTLAHKAGVKLDFIRPGRPGQNGYIESVHLRGRVQFERSVEIQRAHLK